MTAAAQRNLAFGMMTQEKREQGRRRLHKVGPIDKPPKRPEPEMMAGWLVGDRGVWTDHKGQEFTVRVVPWPKSFFHRGEHQVAIVFDPADQIMRPETESRTTWGDTPYAVGAATLTCGHKMTETPGHEPCLCDAHTRADHYPGVPVDWQAAYLREHEAHGKTQEQIHHLEGIIEKQRNRLRTLERVVKEHKDDKEAAERRATYFRYSGTVAGVDVYTYHGAEQ